MHGCACHTQLFVTTWFAKPAVRARERPHQSVQGVGRGDERVALNERRPYTLLKVRLDPTQTSTVAFRLIWLEALPDGRRWASWYSGER